jgi:hypothetical protein
MDEAQQAPQQSGRPQMLTVLCILSFIGSGLAGLSYFLMWATYYEILPVLEEMTEQCPAFEMFLNTGRNFYLTGFILYFLSFFGVSLMWRMRKAGLHFYIASQMMILIMPLFYIAGYPLPYLDGAVTLVFISLYLRFYKNFTA